MSIQYDSTELLGATYIPRYVHHESSPDRLINSIKLARQDGQVIIDDTMDIKYIDIVGVLVGTSASDLETKIDAFKELIARKDKNLDISWAGGTRRYVCRSVEHKFNRDFYNTYHVPYSVRFLVPTGYGKNTSETTALNKSGITATTDTESITFAGSYKPKARHKITLVTRGNADVVRVENTVSGDYMDVDLDGFSNGDYLEIDEENQTVKRNGSVSLNYRGKFPTVEVGAASLKITVTGSGYTLDQEQTSNAGGSTSLIYSNTGSRDPIEYQSFVATKSGRRNKLNLYIGKSGTPGGYAEFAIHADNNGVPGAQIGTAFQIATSGLGAMNFIDVPVVSTAPFLVAGQKYWIRNFSITALTGTDISNCLRWAYSNVPTDYLYGKAIAQKNSGTALVDGAGQAQLTDGVTPGTFDFMFRDYVGDGGAASHNITWQIYYTQKYL